MKFFDYSEAERREWREQDITKAYLAELRFRREEFQTSLRASVYTARFHDAAKDVGIMDGLETASHVATEVTK